MAPSGVSAARRMRAFNRFYTELIGALDDRHEGLGVTLAESRCLFTIDRLKSPDVGLIAKELGLDLGYVSRLVSRLERAGQVSRSRVNGDHRRKAVRLTGDGTALLDELAKRSDARMRAIASHLSQREMSRLLAAMETIHGLIGPQDS